VLDPDRLPPAVDFVRFGAVFLGSPIRANGYLRSVVRFVREHRSDLEGMPVAFFSVGLAVASRTSDGRAQTLEVFEKFVQRTGWRPARLELIAGALPYSKYNFLVRYIMRRIAAKEGGDTDTSRDYEYTDWNAVERFATSFVSEAFGTGPSPAPGEVLLPRIEQPTRNVARA
jgi:menaquinone-dependent protoporphyrinogen oxidase